MKKETTLAKIVGIFGWFNTFALLWAGLLIPSIADNTWGYFATLAIFLTVSLATSGSSDVDR